MTQAPRLVYVQDGTRRTAAVVVGERDGKATVLIRGRIKEVPLDAVGTRRITNRIMVTRLMGWYEVYRKLATPTGRVYRGGD